MKNIGKNDELISLLSGELSLLSSKLYRIDIHNDAAIGLLVELHLELLYGKTARKIKLVFSGIEEYSFYYQRAHYFYYIERYKLFKEGNLFYISLDPCSEDEVISAEDQDFILSLEIEGYYI